MLTERFLNISVLFRQQNVLQDSLEKSHRRPLASPRTGPKAVYGHWKLIALSLSSVYAMRFPRNLGENRPRRNQRQNATELRNLVVPHLYTTFALSTVTGSPSVLPNKNRKNDEVKCSFLLPTTEIVSLGKGPIRTKRRKSTLGARLFTEESPRL
jgi:hypothetical protein